MSQPSVDITQVDGAVGILPPSSGRLLAVVGVSSTGAINTPATLAGGVTASLTSAGVTLTFNSPPGGAGPFGPFVDFAFTFQAAAAA